jgi:hypothetical protein
LFCAISAIFAIEVRFVRCTYCAVWMNIYQFFNVLNFLIFSWINIDNSRIWCVSNITERIFFCLAIIWRAYDTITSVTFFSLYIKILLFCTLKALCEVRIFCWFAHLENSLRISVYFFSNLLVIGGNTFVFGSHEAFCPVWNIKDIPLITFVSFVIVNLSLLALTAFFCIYIEY